MMSEHFYLGLLVGCMGPLAILVAVTTLRGARTRQDAVMLIGDVLVFTVTTLHIAVWGYVQVGNVEQVPALRLCASVLAILAAGLFGTAVFLHDSQDVSPPSPRLRWGTLVGTLLPSWLAGLWAVATREPSAVVCGLTTSAVAAHVSLLRRATVRRHIRALALDDRTATLLHEQMRPHFLFNSIAALRSLCETDPALAASGLDDLAGYLRGNIDALATTRIVPFEQELAHIERYVALEQLNPASSFEVAYDLQVVDFALPVLSVEPLVENAIIHGVRGMGADGLIVVSTERHGGLVRITVVDNGPGMPEGTTGQQRAHVSQGIANVRDRLESLVGGSLDIHSDEQGTHAVMLVPQTGGRDASWSR